MRTLLVLAVLLALLPFRAFAADSSPRERVSFNDGWLFSRTDAEWVLGQLDYANAKPWLLASAADLFGPASPRHARPRGNFGGDFTHTHANYDDSGWRKLNLPHDWGIEGPFKQEYPGDTGKLPWWGVAWYRKHFDVPASDAGRRLVLAPGVFLGEIAFLSGGTATADVFLADGAEALAWPVGELRQLMARDGRIEIGIRGVLSHDLAAKTARSHLPAAEPVAAPAP